MIESSLAGPRERTNDRRAFWLFFTLTFVLALPVVTLARLLPWRLFGAQRDARPSVLAEARAAASAAAGYALMG